MGALPRDATVAVFGAGAMGTGVAQVAARAGHHVQVFDARINAADDAKRRVGEALAALAAKGKLTEAEARDAAARIEPIHSPGAAASAKLVIEAIVEDLEAKRELFRHLEVIAAPDTILATNTSAISITAIGAGLKHPSRVAGMHFFNPAPLMPLVEIVHGLATDPGVVETLHATALAWGKTAVRAASTPGFIVNRCARPYYAEALRLLAERAAEPATLDAVMREAGGFRMGPFELMDLIGHDVNFAVTKGVWDAFFQDPRFTPSVHQQELVNAGYLGRKSGRGFYDYAQGATRPAPATEAAQTSPGRVSVHGDLGPATALGDRFAAQGVAVQRCPAHDAFPEGAIAAGGAWLALSDGRTATARALATGARDLVLFDLACDYGAATRLAVASAETCSVAAYGAAVGALQAAGFAVSRVDDVAGLPVLRTVATLANEAADAVQQGIASAADVDEAMRLGVGYPLGPLAWGDAVGVGRIRDVLAHLADHYGEPRYRIAPRISRRAATGGRLAD